MADPTKATVLIIDDSSVNNLLLENILDAEGYQVMVSFNGKEAFEMMEKEKPDLILLDIMMPGMNGFNVLKEIKSTKSIQDIPIIMVSAKSDAVDIEKSLQMGAVDYIVKPINIKTILDKIQDVLKPN
jgi:DNA-binding response OmpR family regulator